MTGLSDVGRSESVGMGVTDAPETGQAAYLINL